MWSLVCVLLGVWCDCGVNVMVLHELWRVRSMLNITTTIASYDNCFWARLNEYLDNKIAQK
jgi:hypothetical protein